MGVDDRLQDPSEIPTCLAAQQAVEVPVDAVQVEGSGATQRGATLGADCCQPGPPVGRVGPTFDEAGRFEFGDDPADPRA